MLPELAAVADLIARKDREIAELRDALDWYATSSNWRRDVQMVGRRATWQNSLAAQDKGARAKFTLMQMGSR